MGVAGSGKTTVGRLVAKMLEWEFIEGDEFHPQANIEKMSQGTPLTDEDREGWLSAIAATIHEIENRSSSAVISCSALKHSYRNILRSDSASVQFVYLHGTYETIYKRLKARQGHYMKPEMLKSQFATLEEPEDAWTYDINIPQDEIAASLVKVIKKSLASS